MEFILLASAHFLALLSPGPDFFLVVQASLRLQKRYAIAVCAGIASANFVYLSFAVLGIEIIKKWDMLMLTLKYAGAAYLIFLGIMLLRTPAKDLDIRDTNDFLLTQRWHRQFVVGFLSGILNPKNAVFYLSLFTTMVSPMTPLTVRCWYALWMTSIVFCWDVFVVYIFQRQSIQLRLGKRVYLVERFSGAMLAFFGLILPFA